MGEFERLLNIHSKGVYPTVLARHSKEFVDGLNHGLNARTNWGGSIFVNEKDPNEPPQRITKRIGKAAPGTTNPVWAEWRMGLTCGMAITSQIDRHPKLIPEAYEILKKNKATEKTLDLIRRINVPTYEELDVVRNKRVENYKRRQTAEWKLSDLHIASEKKRAEVRRKYQERLAALDRSK